MQLNEKELLNKAIEARNGSYSPYSGFAVGAALITKSGRIYEGANVENASYPCGICAERNAINRAVFEGEREIIAIAIAGGPKDGELTYAYPCGMCRQVMREFSRPDELLVIVGTGADDYKTYTLNELLPDSFGPEQLL